MTVKLKVPRHGQGYLSYRKDLAVSEVQRITYSHHVRVATLMEPLIPASSF